MLHRLSSAHYFETLACRCAPWCGGLALLFLAIGLFWGLFIAPADYQQKDAFRIMYIHVPVAVMSLGVYVSMAVAATVYFVWHSSLAAYYCRSLAVLGATFTLLALVTGALWGKPMWGTYWSWGDARLVSELVLLFLFLGYMSIVSSIEQEKLANDVGSIVLIIGVINVPIIHYSVVWWNSLHQGATLLKWSKPSMPSEMLIPLLLCLLGFVFYTLSYALTAIRTKIIVARNGIILQRKLHR